MSPTIKTIEWNQNAATVNLTGEIDLNVSPRLQEDLKKVIANKPDKIILNLADVPYMDSSGVASLVKLLSRTRARNIELVLQNPSRKVQSIFEITRLTSVFTIENNQPETIN